MENENRIRIVSVNVIGLFGNYDHNIELRKDGLTIIHGPNGVGKTTVLRLIRATLEADLPVLMQIVFDSIAIGFSTGKTLVLNRDLIMAEIDQDSEQMSLFESDDDNQPEQSRETVLTFIWHSDEEQTFEFNSGPSDGLSSSDLWDWAEETPWIRRFGAREWRDMRTNELLTNNDLHRLHALDAIDDETRPRLDALRAAIPHVEIYLIKSQRLILTDVERKKRSRHRENPSIAIEAFANEMIDIIRDTQRKSFFVSQDLDRTFASRVLTSATKIEETEEELRKRYQHQVLTWDDLKLAGIFNPTGRHDPRIYPIEMSKAKDFELPSQLDETQQRVLKFFVDDTDSKLASYISLLEKAQLFLKILNSRFNDKSIRCDVRKGFHVENSRGDSIPLNLLSSGEQHVVVLTYQLIFGIESQSVIMIDEPEISLHIDWQRKFLDEIEDIKRIMGHEFIIATHSPQIVGEHMDHMINLGHVSN